MMKLIEPEDFNKMPDNNSFTMGDLKVIHNVFMESEVPDGWITGQAILGKIEIMLNPTN